MERVTTMLHILSQEKVSNKLNMIIMHWIFFNFTEEVHITTSGYTAKNSDELSFERGVLLDVYQKGLDGWWKAK